MNKKTIRCINYEGLKAYPNYQTGWSDTWIRFHIGRKVIAMAPCIMSVEQVRLDNEIFNGADWHTHWNEPESPWMFAWYQDDDRHGDLPNIVVNKPSICKRDVEDAIGWMLIQRFGFKAPLRFRWDTQSALLVCL